MDLKRKLGCQSCGESDPVCLDFHHRDGKQKKATVSSMTFKTSMKPLLEEIAKCDLLCANCHRKLHHEEKQGVTGGKGCS